MLRGVPANVPMYTLIGRPRAGVCALWTASCFPGTGLRRGHVFSHIARSIGTSVKGGGGNCAFRVADCPAPIPMPMLHFMGAADGRLCTAGDFRSSKVGLILLL